jgi:hypothetical protein
MSHQSEVKEYLDALFEEDEIISDKIVRMEEEGLDETPEYETLVARKKELCKEIDIEKAYYDSFFEHDESYDDRY